MPNPTWAPANEALQVLTYSNQNPSTSQIILSGGQLSSVVDSNGDWEIEIRCVPQFSLDANPTYPFCLYHHQAGDGETSLTYSTALQSGNVDNRYGYFVLKIRGVDVFNSAASPGGPGNAQNVGAFASGQECLIRAWNKPSMSLRSDSCGMRIDALGVGRIGAPNNVGGASSTICAMAASGSPMAAPTSCSIGSRTDGSQPVNMTVDQVRSIRAGTNYLLHDPQGLVIGDSLSANYENRSTLASFFRAGTTYRTKRNIAVVAYPGHKVNDQLGILEDGLLYSGGPGIALGSATLLNGVPFAGVKWAVVELGINDVQGGETAAAIFSYLQNLVTEIKTLWPSSKLVVGLLSPCAGVLSGPAQAVWVTLNGTGTSGITTLTSVDAFVTGHVQALGDNPTWTQATGTCPNLATAYREVEQYPSILDNLHLNNAGQILRASYYLAALNGLGVFEG